MYSQTGYELDHKIYEGIKTIIFSGHRQDDKQPVILKTLKGDQPQLRHIDQLKHEFEVLNGVELDGIIRVLDLIKHKGKPVLVLESIEGVSLRTYVKSNPPDLTEFLNIAIAITEALGNIHRHHIIHKDINMSNVVINPATGKVRIIDFGISSKLSTETQKISNPNSLEGTLAYMSPEQTGRMNRPLDYRTDFYSLGASFYELLTGKPPFPTNDPMALVHCHIAKRAKPPNKIKPDIPAVLAKIVMKLMEKTAEERYQSSFGLKYDLERCRESLMEKGVINDFTLAERDTSDQFYIPLKLYGRDVEARTLMDAFDRFSSGKGGMVMVSGYSGIGKTSLVREIHKPIVKKRGYFISGKFDQFSRNIPYASLVEAFQELVRQLLTESEEQIEQWRKHLLDALGNKGRVIIDLIPEIELIIGQQPEVEVLTPGEAENRLHLVFLDFVHACATREHPLVLFLDDLQWAGLPSLKLIESLVTDPALSHVMLIGSYRDNEVDDTHPLMHVLEAARDAEADIYKIQLLPLEREHVLQLITETLHCSAEDAEPLAELTLEKTAGNPFFLNQFLRSMHTEGLLYFDLKYGKWRWDIAQIRKRGFTDNVVELMVDKIRNLPEETQKVLKLAACIGNHFDLQTLAIVHERPPKETAADLWLAMGENLILPTDDAYKFSQVSDDVQGSYRFPHDRVQQAAYSLIGEDEKRAVHLKIGRLLLAGTPKSDRGEVIFSIVNQLNMGIDLIEDKRERTNLAELNLLAGSKAKASAAYESALKYLDTGKQLLSKQSWETDYDLTLNVYREHATCEYLCGFLEEAESSFEAIIENARGEREKVAVYTEKVILHTHRNRPANAVEEGIRGLNMLGIAIPNDDESLQRAIFDEQKKAKAFWERRGIITLVNLPDLTGEDQLAVMDLLIALAAPTFYFNRNLHYLIVMKMVNNSLNHGNSPSSAFAYATYGTVQTMLFGNYKLGYEFGVLGLELCKKFHNSNISSRVNFVVAVFLNHWVNHIRGSRQYFMTAYEKGLESGNLLFAGYAVSHIPYMMIIRGDHLDAVHGQVTRYLRFLAQSQIYYVADTLKMVERLVLCLKGLTHSPTSFSDNNFDEDPELERRRQAENKYPLFLYCFMKLQALYLAEDYEGALGFAEEAFKLPNVIVGMMYVPEFHFFVGLTVAALCRGRDFSQYYQDKLADSLSRLKTWSHQCPDNYLAKYLLLKAESTRLKSRYWEAATFYDQAIADAQSQGFIHIEAIGNELAARFWMDHKRERFASNYLKRAVYGFHLWGAKGKEARLSDSFGSLLDVSQAEADTFDALSTTTTSQGTQEELDLHTVMKATQAISGKIVLEELLEKLMKIVIENAGAQVGFLLLWREANKTWNIEAEGRVDQARVRVLQSIPYEACPNLSTAIIKYVARTKSSVVLNDAANEEVFANDPYILEKKPKSILCSPIIHQGKLYGILYLENNLSSGVFTPARLELLKVLSGQAAISIENARLYNRLEEHNKNLEQKVEDRTKELKEINGELVTLDDIVKTINREIELENVLQALLEQGLSLFPQAEKGVFLIWSSDKNRFAFAASVGYDARILKKLSFTYEGLMQRYGHEDEGEDQFEVHIVRNPESEKSDGETNQFPSPKSMLAMPLTLEGKLVGYLVLDNFSDAEAFGEADVVRLNRLREHALSAIVKARFLDELKEKNEEIMQAQKQLVMQEKMASLGTLTAGVAHEINNPVNFAYGSVQNLEVDLNSFRDFIFELAGEDAGEQVLEAFRERFDTLFTHVDTIKNGATRIKGIVRDLHSFSRLGEAERKKADVVESVKSTINLVKPNFREFVEFAYAGLDVLELECWPAELGQVFMNLIVNACHAIKSEGAKREAGWIGRLTISVSKEKEMAVLAFQDTGCGMPKKTQEKIFEPFFTTKGVGSGTGLGLSISYGIIQKHHGEIKVASTEGKGTTFTLYLPIETND